jgi:acetylornithine deacetylase
MVSQDSTSYLDAARAGDPLAIAQALVATPSVNPVLEDGGAGEGAIADLTAGWLREWGLEAETIEAAPGRWNVLARLGDPSDGPTVLLNGHLDTVGVAGMTVPPFGAEVKDGRLWGRGSCDMKGGVASLLAAAARLAREDSLPGSLIVALTGDEEHASLGMDALVRSGVRADAAVVCEPTSLAIMPAHKGFIWVDALFRGRAAHGSRPEVGIDAIEHAGRYLAKLGSLKAELNAAEPHPLLAHGSFHAGTISGGAAPSVYPSDCKLVLERRTLPGETSERVMQEFQAVLDGLAGEVPALDAELVQGLTRPATEVPDDSPLVQGLISACSVQGVEPAVEGMTAWVDAAFLNEAGTPAVCFGPGSIGQAHSDDEWIEASEISTCADVLYQFTCDFMAGGR